MWSTVVSAVSNAFNTINKGVKQYYKDKTDFEARVKGVQDAFASKVVGKSNWDRYKDINEKRKRTGG